MRKSVIPALALLALVPVLAARQTPPSAVEVSAVRFFSPASSTTTIEGVAELRVAELLAGAQAAPSYRVEVVVLDSSGVELQRSEWSREVPAALLRNADATTLESFGFRAAPGRYTIRLRVIPQAGQPVQRDVTVRAWRNRPALSDLLLAASVRVPASDSEALAPGEVRRAGVVMRTAPVPRLSATEASLGYYAELYPWTADTARGQLRAAVLSAEGRQLVQTAPTPLEVPPAGGITRGALDLTGLPEGEYRFRLTVQVGDSTLVAEAPFAMGSLQRALAATQPAEVPGATRAEDAIFADADEPRLDSLYAPLVHILERDERGVYENLTMDGKRRFLTAFWRRRDPSPATPDNPRMQEYYAGVAYANEEFRESGSADAPGWRTDRGRVYLRYGRPEEVYRRPQATPRPYEIWKYTRGRQRYYVFYDQSGLGNYYLLATNDRAEPSLWTWTQLAREPGTRFSRDEIPQMFAFLGLPLSSTEP